MTLIPRHDDIALRDDQCFSHATTTDSQSDFTLTRVLACFTPYTVTPTLRYVLYPLHLPFHFTLYHYPHSELGKVSLCLWWCDFFLSVSLMYHLLWSWIAQVSMNITFYAEMLLFLMMCLLYKWIMDIEWLLCRSSMTQLTKSFHVSFLHSYNWNVKMYANTVQ